MKNSNAKGIGCVFLFVTPFFLVGCFTTYLIGDHIVTSLRMHGWTQVDATVLSAKARRVSKGNESSWEISAEYQYVYDGQTYSGNRVGIDDSVGFGGTLRRRAALLNEAQQTNQPVVCYVNAEVPTEVVLFPQVQWLHVFFLGIFSLAFGGVGVGGYALGWFGGRMLRERDQLRSVSPNEPWLWRPEWNRGTIRSGSKGKMISLWVFAGFWNVISAPIPFAIAEEWGQDNKLILLGLLFPVVGMGLLIVAIRVTLVWLKYGRTELVMRSVPGVIGGELVGAIRIPKPVDFEDRVTLTLSCIKKVTSGSGKNRSTSEKVMWRTEHQVDRADVQVTQQTLMPVVFMIPYTCRETDEEKDVEWRLEARGATPGVDFRAQFEIPVFKTADSREDVTEQSAVDPEVRAEKVKEAASASSVHMRELGNGLLELDVPPAAFRSVGSFLGLTLFTAIWTVVIFFITKSDAPILFPIVFGVFGLIMWLAVLQQLTGRKHTRITPDTIEASSRFLCFWSRRTIQASEFRRVKIPVTSRSQTGSKQTLYHSVRVFYGAGTKEQHVDVASSISNKAEAEWIAASVEKALCGE